MKIDLEKVLKAWEYIIGHDNGKLSKNMVELIIQTIQLLSELKQKRNDITNRH